MNTHRITPTFGRVLLVVILFGAIILAGNSFAAAENDHEHNHNHQHEASVVPESQPHELIVVTVSEYGIDGFAIDITPTGILSQLHADQTYDVLIINSGGIAHELMVMDAEMAHMGHEHSEHMSLLTVTTDQLSHRGSTIQAELTFPETGDYTFICHLHPGMETTVTVVT